MGAQYQNFSNGISLEAKASSTNASKGDLEVLSGTGKLNYNNGTTSSPVVTEAHSATLTNKTINGPDNTITNIANSSLVNSSVTVNGNSVSLGGSTTITANTSNTLTIGTGLSGTSFNGSTPVTITIDSSVVTLTGSQVLTNKTLSLTNNTLSGTSAELATAISDETGSGLLVFNNTPTLITPQLNALNVNGTYTLTLPVAAPSDYDTLFHTGSGVYQWRNATVTPTYTRITSSAYTNGTTVTVAGQYNPPSNVKYIKVKMIGGGGAGGGSTSSISGTGGGGAGYLEFIIDAPQATYNFSVGTGGAGSTGAGIAGGTSTFSNGASTNSASGGAGGSSTTSQSGGAGGSYTLAFGSGFGCVGGGGGGGYDNGSIDFKVGGMGGSSKLGGGAASPAYTSNGTAATANSGGGGSGGSDGSTRSGGNGGSGVIIIEEYYK